MHEHVTFYLSHHLSWNYSAILSLTNWFLILCFSRFLEAADEIHVSHCHADGSLQQSGEVLFWHQCHRERSTYCSLWGKCHCQSESDLKTKRMQHSFIYLNPVCSFVFLPFTLLLFNIILHHYCLKRCFFGGEILTSLFMSSSKGLRIVHWCLLVLVVMTLLIKKNALYPWKCSFTTDKTKWLIWTYSSRLLEHWMKCKPLGCTVHDICDTIMVENNTPI